MSRHTGRDQFAVAALLVCIGLLILGCLCGCIGGHLTSGL